MLSVSAAVDRFQLINLQGKFGTYSSRLPFMNLPLTLTHIGPGLQPAGRGFVPSAPGYLSAHSTDGLGSNEGKRPHADGMIPRGRRGQPGTGRKARARGGQIGVSPRHSQDSLGKSAISNGCARNFSKTTSTRDAGIPAARRPLPLVPKRFSRRLVEGLSPLPQGIARLSPALPSLSRPHLARAQPLRE